MGAEIKMVSNKYGDIGVMCRLMLLAKPYWGSIVLIFFLGLLVVPLALLLPVPLKIVVDCVIGSEDMPRFLLMMLPGSMIKSKIAMLIFAVC
jgi:ATP-binding cassette subfamily B protein